jgi:hypothetical protein
MSLDLHRRTDELSPLGARWPGFEQLSGWAIYTLPFSSGDILGLRVLPISDFAPYRSVWHWDPAGDWRVYVDGPALEIGCPRWWGPALKAAALATIGIEWTGPQTLRVTMSAPSLAWTLTLSERPTEAAMNRMGSVMPAWTWKRRPLRAMRELMAHRGLSLGRIRLDGLAPAGMPIVLMPDLVYGVEASHAELDDVDLGPITKAASEPRVGAFPFPVRGVLAIGDFRARIEDEEEYRALVDRYRAFRPAEAA